MKDTSASASPAGGILPGRLLLGGLAGLICAVLPLSAEIVREDGSSLQYRQTDGEMVSLSKRPRRTVIGYGSLAGVWHLAGGTAVGVLELRKKSALPEEMRNLPVVGSPTVPNVEKIVAMKPDLVLLTAKLERHRSTAALLRKSGIPALCVDYGNYDGFRETLDLFRRINGGSAARASEAEQVIGEVRRICAAAAKEKAPRCAIVLTASAGFTLESPRTNTGCMAALLGAENVRKTDFPLRVRYSYEQLLLDNPDVILVIPMGESEDLRRKFRREFMEHSAWNELSAAKSGRVHFLPVDLFLYMPGPRYPEAFRHLASLLYPGKEF